MRRSEPLYVISVAARLLELHPQTLRKYEREGFVTPSRTRGNLRLYSAEDLERLRQVKYLVEERGVNLAGVQLALSLTQQLRRLRERCLAISEQYDRIFDSVVADIDAMLNLLGASSETES
ncbi:MerR family transcriptional regulator [Thermomicrobium sp. 4228-Ro]|uniref:heat shock protein transcriptional repressor HspR n=1 Tax=Thermomicrobium sp. 4228-Ro TaxID=2993937 RepID=UPI00224927F1|nr:MerR family transcriptional regulator [Thermomicrobium sp. 4228-Ro]MCX2726425.1 MerR family transcriptional regulator [Thermomicrobium sp. 4228-Ro]